MLLRKTCDDWVDEDNALWTSQQVTLGYSEGLMQSLVPPPPCRDVGQHHQRPHQTLTIPPQALANLLRGLKP